MLKKIFFFLLLLAPFLLFAEDVKHDPLLSQQMSLSSAVRSALESSKQSMTQLEAYYNSMMFGLETQLQSQSMELTTLSTRLTDTMLSFRNLSAELDNLNIQLTKEQERVQTRNKILFWFGIIGAIILLGKIIAFILYAKRVPIPRWLDIVL